MYVADTFDTALAEIFQATRTVPSSAPNRPYLTVWHATHAPRLLDITGTWPIRNGASHALSTGPHPVSGLASNPRRTIVDVPASDMPDFVA